MTSIALTTREQQVLEGLAQGDMLSDIARRLRISRSTVKTHTAHLYLKLGARSAAHVVWLGVTGGFLTVPS